MLDSSMGLMALLEPHFRQADHELARLRGHISQLTDTARPTIFCEGPTDKTVVEECLRLFFPQSMTPVRVQCSTHHGGGHSWVTDMLIAWSYSRATARAVGLYDSDKDAADSTGIARQKTKGPPSGKMTSTVTLMPNEELKDCARRHFKIPFAIEEILPSDIWEMAETNGWLHDRTCPMALYAFKEQNETFNDYMARVLPEPHLRRIALKKVLNERKEELAEYVVKLPTIADRERVLGGIKPTIEKMLKELGLL